MSKINLPSVPRSADRDTTVFLQAIKKSLEGMSTAEKANMNDAARGYVLKVVREMGEDLGGFIEQSVTVESILDIITGSITESQLSIDLGKRIAKIETTETALSEETQARIAGMLDANNRIGAESEERIQKMLETNQRISTEITHRQAADEELIEKTDILLAATEGNRASIVDETRVRTGLTDAHASRLSALDAKTDQANAHIGTLQTVTADNKSAIATTKTELRAEFKEDSSVKDTRDDNRPPSWYYAEYPKQVAKEFKRKATIGLSSVSGTYVYLETTVKWSDGSGGGITQTAYTDDGKVFVRRSTSTSAWSAWTEQESTSGSQAKVNTAKALLEKGITANAAAIDKESSTRASEIQSVASDVTTLQASVGGNTASVQTHSSAIATINGKLNATWSVKVDANGVVGGIALGSNGQTVDFIVRANTFAVQGPSGSKSVPFIVYPSGQWIGGVWVPAGVYMDTAFIRRGSFDSLSALSANIGHFKSATSGARLEIQDGLLTSTLR